MFYIFTKKSASSLFKKLKNLNKKIVFAESCTAGLLSAALSDIPGSSSVLWGSFVTYTLESKQKMLNVPNNLLEKYGAVSCETACIMAENALANSGADIAVSVTGLAGPGGDGSENSVGTVWIACARNEEETIAAKHYFKGNRQTIRKKAVDKALKIALNCIT
ncbi:MAG: hypothetical protein Ta2G_18710 [Termitinemataceae bacterium]|nr:MAG: hypothetical protein Ta2G_18710 [Termitinemataceae bacterium]